MSLKAPRHAANVLRTFFCGALLLSGLYNAACLGVIETAQNAPAVVNAGPDQHLFRSVPGPVSATLDGSSSCILDDTGTLQYQWQQISGRAVTLAGEQSAVLEVSTEFRGTFTFSLRVDVQRGDETTKGEADFITLIIDNVQGDDVIPAVSSLNLCGNAQ